MNIGQNSDGELQKSGAYELAFRIKQPQPSKPSSLLVLLHGVGSNELSVSELGTDLDPNTLIVLPRGPLILGPVQAAWFRVTFTPTGPTIVEAEAERARQTLVNFIHEVQMEYQISPAKTIVAGFSQGGIMSASVALSQPGLVAGFGVLSGRILPELKPHIASLEKLNRLKAFIGHGEYDKTLPVTWADRSDELLAGLKVQTESHRYAIDHAVSPTMKSDFITWVRSVIG